MSKVIYKYNLVVRKEEAHDDNYATADVRIPEVHKILHFAVQDDSIVLWAEVERDAQPNTFRAFAIVPTGGTPPTDVWSHLATVFQHRFVWHIYG